MNDWSRIRRFYDQHRLSITAAGRNEWANGDAYLWERAGGIQLTPIETWLWSDIRALDAVLYPQYPVGRFFVDFANPVAMVAVECDGAEWHTDKAKDAARDAELTKLGWTVYRITGSDCRTEQDAETGKSGAAYTWLRDIAESHGIRRA